MIEQYPVMPIPSAKDVNKEVEEKILTQEEIEAQIRMNQANLNDPFNKL